MPAARTCIDGRNVKFARSAEQPSLATSISQHPREHTRSASNTQNRQLCHRPTVHHQEQHQHRQHCRQRRQSGNLSWLQPQRALGGGTNCRYKSPHEPATGTAACLHCPQDWKDSTYLDKSFGCPQGMLPAAVPEVEDPPVLEWLPYDCRCVCFGQSSTAQAAATIPPKHHSSAREVLSATHQVTVQLAVPI